MTAEDRQLITTFETRVRSLLLELDKQRDEADELYSMVDERDKQIAELEAQLKAAEQKYETLKAARILQLSDSDTTNAKNRLSAIIREIDLCIAQVKAQE